MIEDRVKRLNHLIKINSAFVERVMPPAHVVRGIQRTVDNMVLTLKRLEEQGPRIDAKTLIQSEVDKNKALQRKIDELKE
jgi:hypothetical protein